MYLLWIEVVSTLLAFTVIWLQCLQKKKSWSLNMAKKGCSFVVFFHRGLYVKCLVDGVLILNSFYGWLRWGSASVKSGRRVGRLGWGNFFVICGFCVSLGWLTGYLFSRYTGSKLPYFDAFHSTFVVATYVLLAHKRLDGWVMWIVANVIFLPVCLQREMYVFFVKYLLYIGMACYGYCKWYREYSAEKGGVTE